MYFVIKRSDGKYVATAGRKHSYTRLLKYAAKYLTEETAKINCCPENESVVLISHEYN